MKKHLLKLSLSILIACLIASCLTGCAMDVKSNPRHKDSNFTIPYMDFTADDYPTTAKPTYTKYVTYETYGAKGDGVTDDSDAIFAAHEYANENNLPVKATTGKTYLIKKAGNKTAIIKTDTDWTGATFIIDDSALSNVNERNFIFSVRDKYSVPPLYFVSDLYKEAYAKQGKPFTEKHPELRNGLRKNATNIGFGLEEKSVLYLVNNNVKRFRRNQGSVVTDGSAQEDTIVVDKNGNIDPGTPLNWDYDTFSEVYCRPISTQTIYLSGGTFITKVCKLNQNVYMRGGIEVLRSNVVIDDVKHQLANEGSKEQTSAPYYGIFYLKQCAYITIKNCIVSSHIVYKNVSGTYDIFPYEVDYLTIFNCHEYTDIKDSDRWGVIGSNFCKNFRLINSTLSRFDAHQGLTYGYIKDSTIGHGGINLTGEGTFKIENSTCYGQNFINLRKDYGSTWHGNIYIKDCTWIPRNGESGYSSSMACILGGDHGENTIGQNYYSWNFGYECYMPEKLFIDGFTIDDTKAGTGYTGPHLLSPFVKANVTNEFYKYQSSYPYHLIKDIYFRRFTSKSGNCTTYKQVSENTELFKDVKIHTSWDASEEN